MSKRGENIYKRKDGRWEGRYIKGRKLDGKIQYGYVFKTTLDIYTDALTFQKRTMIQKMENNRLLTK
jgi:hypothetical protein